MKTKVLKNKMNRLGLKHKRGIMKNDKNEYLENINKIKLIGDLKKDYIEGYEPISKKVVENAIQLY